MTVGDRIKEQRELLGYSQEELANKMGISRQAISKAEKKEGSLTTAKVKKYAEALGCSEAYLMGWTDNPYKEVIKVNVQSEKVFATPAGMYGAEWDNIDPRISEIEDLYFELSEENKLQFYNAAMLIMKGLK